MLTASLGTSRTRIGANARISIAAISVLYLIAVAGSPLTVRGWANHDDLYFLRMASAFLSEGWFGPYGHMTLIKGPTYPLFLALNFLIGLPLLLTTQLAYLAACLAMAWTISLHRVSNWAVVFIFAILILHPIGFTPEMFDVLRSSLFLSLTIASLAAWIAIPRLVKQARATAALSIALAGGACFAAFWMIREEGIWIVPAFAVLPACYLLLFWRDRRVDLIRKYVAMLCIAASVFSLLCLGVSYRNYQRYGFFGTTDMKSSNYQAAYEALTRVRAAEWKPFSPLPAEVREKIYAVSPEFRKIRAGMENKDWWMRYSCDDPMLSYTCGDLNSRTVLWALRDSVAAAGYYKTGGLAEAYYARLAAEVNAACASGALECNSPGTFLVPPLNLQIIKLWWRLLYDATLPRVFFLTDIRYGPMPSTVAELFPYESAITHSRITPTRSGSEMPYGRQDMNRVSGWAYQPGGGALTDIFFQPPSGSPASVVINRSARPDLVTGYKDPKALNSGFDIQFSCADPCYLLFRNETGKEARIAVPRDQSNRGADIDGFSVSYDMYAAANSFDADVRIVPPVKLLGRYDQIKLSIRSAIAGAYSILLPLLLGATLCSIGLCILRWWMNGVYPEPALIVLVLVFGAAWSARVLVVTLFDATFNGTWGGHYDYISPAFSMWALFLGVCILMLFHPLRGHAGRSLPS